MNFTKFSENLGRKIENDLYWLRLVTYTEPVRARAELFTITQTPDIPLYLFDCSDLSPCSGIWNLGAPVRVSVLLICPVAVAEFQGTQIKDIASEYLRL